jgi:hypothetical protein
MGDYLKTGADPNQACAAREGGAQPQVTPGCRRSGRLGSAKSARLVGRAGGFAHERGRREDGGSSAEFCV